MVCGAFPLRSPTFENAFRERARSPRHAQIERAICVNAVVKSAGSERFLVSSEAISGFSRQTRPGKVPTSTASTPSALVFLGQLFHSYVQIMAHTLLPMSRPTTRNATRVPRCRGNAEGSRGGGRWVVLAASPVSRISETAT